MTTAVQTPARDLTPEEQQARAEACFELDQRVKAGLRAGRVALWTTAEALYQFDEAAAYTALGYETLGDWLGDPDVGMTRSTYYRLVKAWRALVVQRNIDGGALSGLDVSKVDVVLPAVESGKVTTETALNDAAAMGWRDLREKYVAPKKAPDPEPDPEPESQNGTEPVDPDAEPIVAADIDATGADPDPDPEPEDLDEDEDEDGPVGVTGKPSEAKKAPPKKPANEVLDEARRCWAALYVDLRAAHDSGQDSPRVAADLIAPGLDGLLVLVDQGVSADDLMSAVRV